MNKICLRNYFLPFFDNIKKALVNKISLLGKLDIEVESSRVEIYGLQQNDELDNLAYDRQEVSNEEKHVDDYNIVRDRTRRMIRALPRYKYTEVIAYLLVTASEVLKNELSSVSFSLTSKQKIQWLDSMNDEMKLFHLNNISTLACKPVGSWSVSCKWIFKQKYGIKELINKN